MTVNPELKSKSVLRNEGFHLEEPGFLSSQPVDQAIRHLRVEAKTTLDFFASCPDRFGEGDAVCCLGNDKPVDRILREGGIFQEQGELFFITLLLTAQLYSEIEPTLERFRKGVCSFPA